MIGEEVSRRKRMLAPSPGIRPRHRRLAQGLSSIASAPQFRNGPDDEEDSGVNDFDLVVAIRRSDLMCSDRLLDRRAERSSREGASDADCLRQQEHGDRAKSTRLPQGWVQAQQDRPGQVEARPYPGYQSRGPGEHGARQPDRNHQQRRDADHLNPAERPFDNDRRACVDPGNPLASFIAARLMPRLSSLPLARAAEVPVSQHCPNLSATEARVTASNYRRGARASSAARRELGRWRAPSRRSRPAMNRLYQAGITPPPAHGGRGNREHPFMESSPPKPAAAVRCANCRALLFKAEDGAIAGTIEIKCRRCGAFNFMRPPSPSPTANGAARGSLLCGSTCPIRARTG